MSWVIQLLRNGKDYYFVRINKNTCIWSSRIVAAKRFPHCQAAKEYAAKHLSKHNLNFKAWV